MLGPILVRFGVFVLWGRLGLVACLVLLFASRASAFPSSRLVYVRGPGAESCPDQTTVREAVKARLGYDPFFHSADKTIIAHVLRDAAQLRGEVELVDEHGTQVGRREFDAPLEQCDQLVHAMALSISIAIDPKSSETYEQGPRDSVTAEPDESQPDSPEPPAVESAPARVASAAVPRAESSASVLVPWLWSAGVGPTLQFGSLPQLAFGLSAFGALREGRWSIALEAEFDLPVTTIEQGVELTSSLFAVKLIPCGHWGPAFACQVTALRWFTATGTASNLGGSALTLALGARLGAVLPISSSLSALGYADLLATPAPVRLVSEGHDVWQMPVASGALGIAGVVHFR